MKRTVYFRPAWDERKNAKGNFGVNGVDLIFRTEDTDGALEFRILTNWMLPSVDEENLGDGTSRQQLRPIATQVYRHSFGRVDEDDKFGECHIYPQGCYSNVALSYYESEKLFDALRIGGDEALWTELEALHKKAFQRNRIDTADRSLS